MSTIEDRLPNWIRAEDQAKWAKWVKIRAASCRRREKKCGEKTGNGRATRGNVRWTEKILEALHHCEGFAAYSHLKLDISQPHTSPFYPSIDHVEGIGSAKVKVETRLVNDMKTILDETEFKQVIGHLASALGAKAVRLKDGWKPKRTFARLRAGRRGNDDQHGRV